jgi:hypothetical protein
MINHVLLCCFDRFLCLDSFTIPHLYRFLSRDIKRRLVLLNLENICDILHDILCFHEMTTTI